MARSTLSTVRRITYENLGITTGGSYGTLLSNARYPTEYIDDKIAEADITIVELLLKNKQHQLVKDLYTTQTGVALNENLSNSWHIIDVKVGNAVGAIVQSIGTPITEISFNDYQLMSGSSIYDVATYPLYYAIHNSKIWTFLTTHYLDIVYVDLTHPTTLTTLLSPTGFESAIANLASALLLMKRGDKPEQAKFYLDIATDFLKQFLLPDSNEQNIISD